MLIVIIISHYVRNNKKNHTNSQKYSWDSWKKKCDEIYNFCGRLMERDMKGNAWIHCFNDTFATTHTIFFIAVLRFFIALWTKRRERLHKNKNKRELTMDLRMEEFNKISLSVYRFLLCLSFLLLKKKIPFEKFSHRRQRVT